MKHLLVTVLALSLLACASDQTAGDGGVSAFDMANPKQVNAELMSAGQPSADDLAVLKSRGYDLVVNLRTSAEAIDFDEASAVRALGMTYVHIPVGVPDGLSADNAAKLNEALANSKGPALVHCASGNRAGALLALRAYHHQNADPEDALELGRRAGVTRLEDSLRERLGLTDETQGSQ